MMGRTMPTECPHGKILDWGDFGPDHDDGSVAAEQCLICDDLAEIAANEQNALFLEAAAQRCRADRDLRTACELEKIARQIRAGER